MAACQNPSPFILAVPCFRRSRPKNCWVVPEVNETKLAQRQQEPRGQRAAQRRQSLAPGERVPTRRDNPGINPLKDPSPRSGRQMFHVTAHNPLRPYRARDCFVTDPGVALLAPQRRCSAGDPALRSLTPGYYLPPLRGWLSGATQHWHSLP